MNTIAHTDAADTATTVQDAEHALRLIEELQALPSDILKPSYAEAFRLARLSIKRRLAMDLFAEAK